jgi:TolA-binding protein
MKLRNSFLIFFLFFLAFYLFSSNKEINDELFLKAEKYEKEGNISEAIRYYEKYNNQNNNLEDKEKIDLKIARIIPDYEIKVKRYKEFLEKYPDSQFRFLVRYELANLFKLNNKYQKAIIENIKLANLAKSTVYWQKANINIAILKYTLNEYELAAEVLNDLLKKIDDYEDLGTVYYLLGKIMVKQLKYKEAEKLFLICAGSYPQSSKGALSLFELQNVYILLSKYSEAERIALMLNQLYPDSLENKNAQKRLETIKVDKNKKYLEIELINLNNDIEIKNISTDNIKKELKSSMDIFDESTNNSISKEDKAYYIQMGYFSKLDNVKEVIRVFKSKGILDVFYARTRPSSKSKGTSYRILIGPFHKKSDANKRLIDLKDKNIESIILELYKYYD